MPINLPNGANVEEIVLPDGSQASEVIGPDGSTVWERNAIPDGTVENFEEADADTPGVYESDQDLSDYYDGSLSDFSRTETDVIEGSFALNESNSSSDSVAIISNEGNGLNRYPEKGDAIEALIRDGSNNRQIPYVLTNAVYRSNDDEFDAYGFRIDPARNEINIDRYDSSTPSNASNGKTTLQNETVDSISQETYYWVEIELPGDSGDMRMELFDADTGDLSRGSSLGSATATDTNYIDNRGIGWSSDFEGTGTMADLLRVVE